MKTAVYIYIHTHIDVGIIDQIEIMNSVEIKEQYQPLISGWLRLEQKSGSQFCKYQ